MNSLASLDKVLKDLNKLIDFIKVSKGIDLHSYRASFVLRRLQLRMGNCETNDILEYIEKLGKEPEEWDRFTESLSINVSKFFRDPEVFDFFREHSLANIIETKREKGYKTIRLWSAGCSFGEEPYSLAIMLFESLKGKDKQGLFPRVIATDIDRNALDRAKRGEFSESSLGNVKPVLLKKYFMPTQKGTWIVNSKVKDLVRFKQHNLLVEAPFKLVDAIFCRNVRIYFNQSDGQKVIANLAKSLNQGGRMVLGKVETLPLLLKNELITEDGFLKIFKKYKSTKGR